VNLIGEHLDYNGGQCLPLALGYRTKASLETRDDRLLVVTSRQEEEEPVELAVDEIDEPRGGWTDYVVGVLRELDVVGSGWTVDVDGRVPLGAGLSSSAAIECAVAVAAVAAAELDLSTEEIVDACVRAENDYVGAPTGRLDQSAAMFAAEDHALLLDFSGGARRDVPWDPDGELLIIDTQVSHQLSGSEYAERRSACEKAASLLGVDHLVSASLDDLDRLEDDVLRRRVRHVLSENARVTSAVVAAEQGDWRTFGRLMTESHSSLRDDYEVSCAELDVAVDAALDAGALGARMTGGGFGGSAIALVPPGRVEQVQSAVAAAYEREGWDPPRFLDGTAGGPARLE
jgi:galactokinase